jgi:SAM-dependent methyltransferase
MREAGLERLSSISLNRGTRDFLVMHYLIRDLKWAIYNFAKGKVFDIGCGNKPYEKLFEGKIDSYQGCDIVQSSLNRVDVICEATQIPIVSNSFNTIISTQVMEHINAPEAMLSEANRLLEDGGNIILSIPFCWELHEEPFDFFRYSKYGLQAMLERNGFEIISIKANGGKWAAIIQMNLNIWYSAFMNKDGIIRKVFKFLFLHAGLTWLLNSLGLWMDKKWYDELLTLNYVVVGRKK